MDDLISRRSAIKALLNEGLITAACYIDRLPTAEPEIKPIEYRDCANAMLRMWMDNVVTDGEYNRIMDKLNAYCIRSRKQ